MEFCNLIGCKSGRKHDDFVGCTKPRDKLETSFLGVCKPHFEDSAQFKPQMSLNRVVVATLKSRNGMQNTPPPFPFHLFRALASCGLFNRTGHGGGFRI